MNARQLIAAWFPKTARGNAMFRSESKGQEMDRVWNSMIKHLMNWESDSQINRVFEDAMEEAVDSTPCRDFESDEGWTETVDLPFSAIAKVMKGKWAKSFGRSSAFKALLDQLLTLSDQPKRLARNLDSIVQEAMYQALDKNQWLWRGAIEWEHVEDHNRSKAEECYDAEYESANPYASRGLSRSDFW